MNIKKFLNLSDDKLKNLENKYNMLPSEYEIEQISLSYDRTCLKETAKIARLRAQEKITQKAEAKLKEKRKQAILNMFVKPE